MFGSEKNILLVFLFGQQIVNNLNNSRYLLTTDMVPDRESLWLPTDNCVIERLTLVSPFIRLILTVSNR